MQKIINHNNLVYALPLLIFWILISSAMAATYYVDNAVAVSGSGTSWAAAWKNFSDINWSIITAGDTIYISGGSISKNV